MDTEQYLRRRLLTNLDVCISHFFPFDFSQESGMVSTQRWTVWWSTGWYTDGDTIVYRHLPIYVINYNANGLRVSIKVQNEHSPNGE